MWLGLWLVDVPPSPNVHANVKGDVPPEAVPVKVTAAGAVAAERDAVAVAVSGAGEMPKMSLIADAAASLVVIVESPQDASMVLSSE